MPSNKKSSHLLGMLITLTLFFVVAQISLLVIDGLTHHVFDTLIFSSITLHVLESKIFIFAFVQFIAAQFLLYVIYVSFIYYAAVIAGRLFRLQGSGIYLFGIFLWIISVIGLLLANLYFVPHSFFSILIQKNILRNDVNVPDLKAMLIVIAIVFLCLGFTVVVSGLKCIWQSRSSGRYIIVVAMGLLVCVGFLFTKSHQFASASTATAEKPNIIIIGFDALRPDFIGPNTPNMNAFLKDAVTFSNSSTPLARTFPSWATILTGMYPLHTHIRVNNTDLHEIRLAETLPKSLKTIGYQTYYATDDVRYNGVDQEFGFDKVISPPIGVNDFIIGNINDFLLSNLLIATPVGKILFPYSYGNHGAAITFDPNNFLSMLSTGLEKNNGQPLFLSVHFNITAWPFYWFNDQQLNPISDVDRYRRSIAASDKLLANFLEVLNRNHLLDHAIVILLSDHGMTFGLHGDRMINSSSYLGNKDNVKKVARFKYAEATQYSFDFKKDYGLDTSYGYGSDLLSLKQNHNLLSFKGYGVSLGAARSIDNKVSLLDITPTIVDYLKLPFFAAYDGLSLKPYFESRPQLSDALRPFYFETSMTLPEIETQGISVEKVFNKALKLYQMDAQNGRIFLAHDVEKAMELEKQVAVLQGEWMLVHFPAMQRNKMVWKPNKNLIIESYLQPPYYILMNLKTGKWTIEMRDSFAATSPFKSLQAKLQKFYSKELIADSHAL